MSNYAVTCYTCRTKIWEGDEPPADGQVLLTEYADKTPGTECPSKVADCPHKTAAVAERVQRRPATLADLEGLKIRLSALERGRP